MWPLTALIVGLYLCSTAQRIAFAVLLARFYEVNPEAAVAALEELR